LLRNPGFGVSFASCSARAIAPFIPSLPGVNTNFAPNIASNVRRSSDMVSGIVKPADTLSPPPQMPAQCPCSRSSVQ
jgi:hypothetical protein